MTNCRNSLFATVQASLEAETKAKEEALRIKKKIESNINELEIALDHANKANAEAAKQVGKIDNISNDKESIMSRAKL